jgi:hypothetical protein
MTEPDNDPVVTLLDGLRPAAPSDELMRRLAALRPVLRMPTLRDKVILFVPRIATAAALIALASALVWRFYPRGGDEALADNAPVVSEERNLPLAAISVPMQLRQRLLGVQDLGVTRDAAQGAVRLMRARWWDDQTFTPPGGAPPVRQERLREEIVPVVVNTF